MTTANPKPVGGAFLVAAQEDAFSPEDFRDDQRQIKAAVDDFARRELAPAGSKLEAHDQDLLLRLFRQAGSLGFLGVDVPEAFGGLGLDLTTSALVFEGIGGAGNGSFAVTAGAHTGIGTWPILFFGNDEQRQRYLPGIASGDLVAAYALTEPGSGSDALAAKTTAVRAEDGAWWTLNGGKTFITNGGFADVYTVFAKVGGQNACFIVDRGAPGFTLGKEEEKLGIRGSSTCSLNFDDARVPAANLLGVIGKGHKIVLNTLNLGRFKLGAAAVGSIKASLATSVQYAAGRRQFGKPILEFDAIRAKISEMAAMAWVGESMVYRTAGLLDASLHGIAPGEHAAKAIEEYAAECSLVKVATSEMYWEAANHAVQIFGGYGYIEEYPVARAMRDARINMIFEGTNEINRMLAVGDLLKRGMRGQFDLMGAIAAVDQPVEAALPLETALAGAKKATLYALGQAVQQHMTALETEQQVLIELADMCIAVYAMDSALLRLRKVEKRGVDASLAASATALCFHRGLTRIAEACGIALASLPKEVADKASALLGRESHRFPVIACRRRLADAAAAKGGYPF